MPAYKDKKRGTWYAKFNYRDYSGNNKQKLKRGFETRRAALQFEREFLLKQQENKEITIKALCESYLEYLKPRIRESSYITKASGINKYIIPAFGDRAAGELTAADIARWQSDLIKCGRLANTTLHIINGYFSSIFNYGIKFCGLSVNPVRAAGSAGASKSDAGDYWTYQEYRQFRAVITSLQDLALFDTLFFTGARIGEILALRWSDIDFINEQIDINKTITKTEDGLKTGPPKTKTSARIIDIPASLADRLREYRGHLYGVKDSDSVFCLYNATVRYRMKKYIKKSGVKDIRLHDIRHSHASFLIARGVDILTVSRRLGHTNTSTTLNLYGHMYEKNRRAVATLLNGL